MRIVGGELRGRRLSAPRGRALRPTSERVREALFDVLERGLDRAAPFAGSRVVDVFAGTGMLGFEALSRGATHACFVERDGAALAQLRRTAERLGLGDRVTVVRRDATRLGPAAAPCRCAFLDPPYRSGLAASALARLAAGGWLDDGAVAVVEHRTRETLAPPAGFALLDARRYGATQLVFLAYADA